MYSFAGEGFAGFAWGSDFEHPGLRTQRRQFECGGGGGFAGLGRHAGERGLAGQQLRRSYEGLYYSTDSGANWSLATITDGTGADVQGPPDLFDAPDGNAATAVVWNPVRQSVHCGGALPRLLSVFGRHNLDADDATSRAPNLTASAGLCPTNPGMIGSTGCPIFRGALAVNPATGDTFAWTVDIDNQDQGMWQDSVRGERGACASSTIAFAQQWSTAALETNTSLGAATIANGDYNLALAAVPVRAGDDRCWPGPTTCGRPAALSRRAADGATPPIRPPA